MPNISNAWGNQQNQASDEVKDNRYRYAGYQYDEETGLYYLMALPLRAKKRRILITRPRPGSDGDSLDQNGYTYGNNNPVMNVDPTGIGCGLGKCLIAAYDGYGAYKSGKGWRGAAWAAS